MSEGRIKNGACENPGCRWSPPLLVALVDWDFLLNWPWPASRSSGTQLCRASNSWAPSLSLVIPSQHDLFLKWAEGEYVSYCWENLKLSPSPISLSHSIPKSDTAQASPHHLLPQGSFPTLHFWVQGLLCHLPPTPPPTNKNLKSEV